MEKMEEFKNKILKFKIEKFYEIHKNGKILRIIKK
jgi:hypothetical protein